MYYFVHWAGCLSFAPADSYVLCAILIYAIGVGTVAMTAVGSCALQMPDGLYYCEQGGSLSEGDVRWAFIFTVPSFNSHPQQKLFHFSFSDSGLPMTVLPDPSNLSCPYPLESRAGDHFAVLLTLIHWLSYSTTF